MTENKKLSPLQIAQLKDLYEAKAAQYIQLSEEYRAMARTLDELGQELEAEYMQIQQAEADL